MRFFSTLSGSTLSRLIGTVNSSSQLTTTIRSATPGTAIITAQDLTTGETFAASASVTFTPVEGQPPPPPSDTGDIVITDVKGDCGQINCPVDGFFMLGLDGLRLPLKATVDWKGQPPGVIEFTINGYTQTITADAQGARFELDINQRLHEGPNVLSIVARSGDKSSKSFDLHLDGYRLPQWIMDGVDALPTIGNQALVFEIAFPGQPLGDDSPINWGFPGDLNRFQWQTNIKMTLPTRGGPFEIEVSRDQHHADQGRPAKAQLYLLGHKADLGFAGTLRGVLGPDAPYVIVQQLEIEPSLKATLAEKSIGIPDALNALPPFGPVANAALYAVPPVRDWLNDRAKLYVKVSVDLSGQLTFDFQPGFRLANAQGQADFPVEAGARVDLWVVEGHLYGGLGGKLTLGYEADDMRIASLQAYGFGGYKFRLTWFSIEDRGDWKLAEWPPESGQLALTFTSRATEPLAWRLIGHAATKDYAAFRAAPATRQAFAPFAVQPEPLRIAATAAITSVLVSNVYTYPEPSLAVQPVSGDALLLWMHDDVAKPVGQAQEIAFSRWDGSAWSVPAGVTDDDKLDGAPQVAWAAAGEGVAVWQRLNETLPITATFDVTTAQKIEIATAVYSPTLGAWSPASLLTDNAGLDMTPRLAHNPDGKLLAAWRQNDAGLLSGTVTDTDRIVAAFYDGGWGAAAVAVNGIPGLVDLAAGYGDGTATVAFTRYLTPTGSLTPTLQLFTAAWDGAAWAAALQRTDDDLGHRSPQVVYNAANEPLVVWLVGAGLAPAPAAGTGQGQALSLRNLATAATATLTLPSEIGAIDEFRVVQDAAENLAAVFTAQAGQRDLFVAFFDQAHGVWGNPVRLTDDRASEAYPAPGLDPTGRLLMGYAATAITPITHTTTISETGEVITYTLPTEGQTDLLTLSHAFTRNLTLADSDFTIFDDHPAPGATVVLSATVHNTGDLALDGVAVSFYDGDPDADGTLIATQVWPAPLAAGFTATLTTTYAVPTTGGVRNLYAVADPAHAIAEANEADNTAHLAAFGPDLELASAGAEPWGGSDVGLVTVVRNLGTTVAPTSTVAFYGEDVTSLTSQGLRGSAGRSPELVRAVAAAPVITDTLPALAAGATFTLTTPWNYGALPEGSYALTATVNPGGASFTEVVTANNTSGLALPVRPDLSVNPLYVWAAPLPDGTMVVTAAVSNFGSIAAPAATVEIYVDGVFSDTAHLRTLTLPAIAPASQVYVTATWGSPTAGEHTSYVVVNADRSVAELTWANNIASAWAAGPLTDLRATKDVGGATLSWTHGGRSVARYEVYRSTNPYFSPGGADAQKLNDVLPPVAGSAVSYTDAAAFGSPTGAYFYAVVTVDRAGLVYPASNRVGAFSFGLTPGAP